MGRERPVEAPPAGSQRALVLDTNVVLDWLVFADPSTDPLVQALASCAVQWIATEEMRCELVRVLTYPQIAPHLLRRSLAPDAVLVRFDTAARLMPPAPSCAAVCKDPDDQRFIDLAVAHRAVLLSKDRAVLALAPRLVASSVQVARAMAHA